MSEAHFLPKGVSVCATHPNARVLSDNALDVCVCTYNPPPMYVQQSMSAEQQKPVKQPKNIVKEEEEQQQKEVFKTPEEIAVERQKYHEERRRVHVRDFERNIAASIEDMVATGQDTCKTEYNVYTRYPLIAADYADMKQRLDAKGYTVTFIDKVTGQSIDVPVPTTCTCCASGIAEGEGESVLREMRRIRDAACVWWNRVNKAPNGGGRDYQVVEARVALKKTVPRSVEQQQPLHAPHQQQNVRVLETLLTCPVWVLLLGFAIVPCLLPRFVFPFWQLFVMFVLVARLVRWTSGTAAATTTAAAAAAARHSVFVPCSTTVNQQQHHSCQ